MRKLIPLSATVVALLVVGAMPAASRAETGPHWFSEGRLVGGEPMRVEGEVTGLFGLNFLPLDYPERPYICFGTKKLTISNPPGGGPGIDEIVTFRLTSCSEPRYLGRCGAAINKVTPLGLPWRGHLAVELFGHVVNVFEGVTLELTCNKRSFRGVFSGTLHPEILGGIELSFGGKAEVLSGALGQVELFGGETLRGPRGNKKITAA
jgi:hypothetical protein